MATSITVRSHKDVSCPTALHPHVALCVGAHGSCLVGWRPLRRPVCGRTVCASVPVKSYCVKLVRQRTLRPSVPTAVVSVRPLRQTDTSSCCRQNKTSPCRDARSVRPPPLKATVSSWFEQRTHDRTSLRRATHHLLRQLVMIRVIGVDRR